MSAGPDYAQLRREGIRYLERITGGRWTDFNVHDPGITILEQLCYAITDVMYRASHEVPDLLASGGRDPGEFLHEAASILGSNAVSPDDLRRLAIDTPGVENAWVERSQAAQVLARHRAERAIWELSTVGRGDAARIGELDPRNELVTLAGIHRVLLEPSEVDPVGGVAGRRTVIGRLQRQRGLGEDFEVKLLDVELIRIHATVEIAPTADAEMLHSALLDRIARYISPRAIFRGAGELLAGGASPDALFDGPALMHGFIDAGELLALERRTEIHTSDLIRAMMSVPGVRAVSSISVSSGQPGNAWSQPIGADAIPRLDRNGSEIVLRRGQVPIRVSSAGVAHADQDASARGYDGGSQGHFALPTGRDRAVDRYHSIQHQFPDAFGVGPNGIPRSTGDERRTRAMQLKAYLLFFDQLLSSELAQLAHVSDLFAFSHAPASTYFSQVIDDPDLGLEEVLKDEAGRAARLAQITQATAGERSRLQRKHRFLDHLLARFAERMVDHASDEVGDAGSAKLLEEKAAYLRSYARISRSRGTGFDYLGTGDSTNVAGLHERLRLALGLDADAAEPLVVEHLLLRPLPEDAPPHDLEDWRRVPLLEVGTADPYSYQLTLALCGSGRGADPGFRQRVERLVMHETPAHLVTRVIWPGTVAMRRLASAYQDWTQALGAYRRAADEIEHGGGTRHFSLRDARDRLLELLDIGTTYPLLDLPVSSPARVAFASVAKVSIAHSQRGVRYRLYDAGEPVGEAGVEGNGTTLVIETQPVDKEVTYEIGVDKIRRGRGPDAALRYRLYQRATIKVGLDTALRASIRDAELLDAGVAGSRFDAPRIVDHASSVRVEIERAQEGVAYRLVSLPGEDVSGAVVLSQGDVVGLGHLENIHLLSKPLREDTEVRILALQEGESALLDVALPVVVRADPLTRLSVDPPVVEHGARAVLTIESSQESASYRLFARTLDDAAFVRPVAGEPRALDVDTGTVARVADDQIVAIDAGADTDVHVRRSARAHPWSTPEGFEPITTALGGNGGELRFELGPVDADLLIVVQASKQHSPRAHAADGARAAATSSVELARALGILVRPNPEPPPRLRVPMGPEGTLGSLEVSGGVPGTFYAFTGQPEVTASGSPAYFHQHDAEDPAADKGLGQLAVEVDLVVPRPNDARESIRANLETVRVDTAGFAPDSRLRMRAVKARSGVGLDLPHQVKLWSMPTIRAAEPVVDHGAATTIEVLRSRRTEHYVLQLERAALEARDGTGAKLSFQTPTLTDSTRFELVASRGDADDVPLERAFPVTVSVRPDPRLTVAPRNVTAGRNETTEVRVLASQPGVRYQLLIDDVLAGDAVEGTGEQIELASGPLAATTVFRVLASRADSPDLSVVLEQSVTVAVRSESGEG